ncbi:MAG: acetyl/propionyl/methylcrotonyl-CoA carboxylase subunit alpha [Acidiphilium sp.]|nr:acetyl/propionyl/methylcrotonyl-CoA carboxylase subunit alpha [Acidiphilium sp.]MDD4934885.1 acetyl/propionyl/methylcrotonyl-CoA carboxylase subunit alpha [Acidiphilium sp.]
MFTAVLIANRGEIACRIIRTARRMGLRSIAVFSEADRNAGHVALADEAVCIGPAPARESYLDIERIIAAARRTGAQTVHPGYGFLSENAAFAEACAQAGLIFIGPPPAAIRAMGSKSAAKALMEQAGVPLVPGYHGDEQNPRHLATAAGRIGYPVLIKASAGGGGKGMRIVTGPGDFLNALELAKGEARAAFGDDHVLVEKYLIQPRHIEIQVFADTHGNVVSLFERDCSIQRRHQKIIEEAPAPSISEVQRLTMGEAACTAARAIAYVGAGTVEFIAEDGEFYFMEMNTRLQVEHPVTEMITGLDLVEWQFRVAAGEALPLTQNEIERSGHAIEVRIYAEDPAREFAPSTGTLNHWRLPEVSANIRIDSGVRQGDDVSIHYDPMIAKLIAWDHDRDGAIRHLRQALAGFEVDGVRTNLDLLRRIVAHPDFVGAVLDTGFISRRAEDLLADVAPPPAAVFAATLHCWLRDLPRHVDPFDPYSPWNTRIAWRLNGSSYQDVSIYDADTIHAIRVYPIDDGYFQDGGHFQFDWNDRKFDAGIIQAGQDRLQVTIDDAICPVTALHHGRDVIAFHAGQRYALRIVDKFEATGGVAGASGRITTAMPGRVVAVAVGPGDRVAAGDLLVTIEAMKVQFRIVAPRAGVIATLRCGLGDLVEDGAELAIFEAAPG